MTPNEEMIQQKPSNLCVVLRTFGGGSVPWKSHAGTLVSECFTDDNMQVNGKVKNSTSAPSETPEPVQGVQSYGGSNFGLLHRNGLSSITL